MTRTRRPAVACLALLCAVPSQHPARQVAQQTRATVVLALDDAEFVAQNAHWTGAVLHVMVSDLAVEQFSRVPDQAGADAGVTRTVAAAPNWNQAGTGSAFALSTLRPVREAILSEIVAENDVRRLLRCRSPNRASGLQLDGGRAYLQIVCGSGAEVTPRLAAILANDGMAARPPQTMTLRYRIGSEVPIQGDPWLQAIADVLRQQPGTEIAVVVGPGNSAESDSLLQRRIARIRRAAGSERAVLARIPEDSASGPTPVFVEAEIVFLVRF